MKLINCCSNFFHCATVRAKHISFVMLFHSLDRCHTEDRVIEIHFVVLLVARCAVFSCCACNIRRCAAKFKNDFIHTFFRTCIGNAMVNFIKAIYFVGFVLIVSLKTVGKDENIHVQYFGLNLLPISYCDQRNSLLSSVLQD